MGYCIQQTEQIFLIPAEKVEAAHEAIKSLAGQETIPSPGGGKHFSWVSEDFAYAADFKSIMNKWRYDIEEDEKGNVIDIWFTGEKLGDDELLFKTIAPFIKAESYIQFSGEDDHIWRYCFDGKKMKEQYAELTWK